MAALIGLLVPGTLAGFRVLLFAPGVRSVLLSVGLASSSPELSSGLET